MSNPKPVYFNDDQIRFVKATQKTRVLIAGRGFGKSTLLAWIFLEMLTALPGGKVFLASTTVEQIKNNILPPIRAKWAEFGLVEGVHFVVGKRPPSWFLKPISPPDEFENSVTFWNGFSIMLLSTAKPAGKRGGSYDAGIVDEAAFVKRLTFTKVLRPMSRGNRYLFWEETKKGKQRVSRWHHVCIALTSQPDTPDGHWVYDFEDKAKLHPKRVLFMECSAQSNIDVLGKEWFREQRQDLGHLDYLREIENQRVRQIPNGFYHKFQDSAHTYSPLVEASGRMLDVRVGELLEASFDFGGKFNCCTVWQEHENVERCLRQFWVKDEGKIAEVVKRFCEHFSGHQFKYVRVWGEPRGHDRNPLGSDIYTIIQAQLEAAGWMVEVKVQTGYATKRHKERYQFAAEMMTNNPSLPRLLINSAACPDLIIAMQTCDILEDYRKNKSKEKDDKYPQQHAPHLSDTLDYYLIDKHGWKLSEAAGGRGGEAW